MVGWLLISVALFGLAVWQLARAYASGKCNLPPVDTDRNRQPEAFWIAVIFYVGAISAAAWIVGQQVLGWW